MELSRIGLCGLAVMGQNLALNIASKGFRISVYNRTVSKVDETVERAQKEGNLPLVGFHTVESFVKSIQKPRCIIILVKAGTAVDQTIAGLKEFLEPGDCIIDGGNEWYENTERRMAECAKDNILYMGMGVSGGEEGARHGPSLMPGGTQEAYKLFEDVVIKAAAQVDSSPCVTYVGPGGSGNFVKMIHNGIEYGDMQLIAEAYDILKNVAGLTNDELAATFREWNKGELDSFLIEITARIFAKEDDQGAGGALVDKIVDKTGSKGTGKWTVQQAADLGVAAPTITASLDARYMSSLKEERQAAEKVFDLPLSAPVADKAALIADVRSALYASKICSYAQGMNIIRAKSMEKGWNLDLGAMARIWKGGCIIRAVFLDRIKQAFDRDPNLPSLLMDPAFAKGAIRRNHFVKILLVGQGSLCEGRGRAGKGQRLHR
eukprot:jgi/Mesvir1/17613/Mv08839-RA.2